MTAYADAALFTSLTGHLQLDRPDDIDQLLARSSDDIDSYLSWPAPVAAGRRIDVSTLTEFQQDCLARACCMQAAYRVTVDETDDLIVGRPRLTALPGGIAVAPTAPDLLGPQTLVLLQGAGLLKRSGCAAPPPPDPPHCGWTLDTA